MPIDGEGFVRPCKAQPFVPSPVPHFSDNCHSPKQCRAGCNLYESVNSEGDQRDAACKCSCYYRNQSIKTVPGDGEILQSFSTPGAISWRFNAVMTKAYQAEQGNQAEMAERVGIDRSFLAEVERARAAPSESNRQNECPALASGTRLQSKSQKLS